MEKFTTSEKMLRINKEKEDILARLEDSKKVLQSSFKGNCNNSQELMSLIIESTGTFESNKT